jgi:hypothetical protein
MHTLDSGRTLSEKKVSKVRDDEADDLGALSLRILAA